MFGMRQKKDRWKFQDPNRDLVTPMSSMFCCTSPETDTMLIYQANNTIAICNGHRVLAQSNPIHYRNKRDWNMVYEDVISALQDVVYDFEQTCEVCVDIDEDSQEDGITNFAIKTANYICR